MVPSRLLVARKRKAKEGLRSVRRAGCGPSAARIASAYTCDVKHNHAYELIVCSPYASRRAMKFLHTLMAITFQCITWRLNFQSKSYGRMTPTNGRRSPVLTRSARESTGARFSVRLVIFAAKNVVTDLSAH